MNFLQHSYTKVGEHRGKSRIWLQGLRLASAGFSKGERYRIDYDMNNACIELVLDKNGNRIVSGKKVKDRILPIVDICNSDIINVTQGEERVRVDFAGGYIRVSIHHHVSKQAERENRLKVNLDNGCIKEGSMCTGGGVAALAVKTGLGIKGVKSSLEWVVDRERKYLQVACDNNSALDADTTIIEGTLEEVESSLLKPVDLLQVSLTCCPYGASGKAKNKIKLAEEHKDATAMFGLMRVVESVNPSIIISENVCGSRDSATYLLIKGMLETLGYVIHEFDLDSKQAGSFEQRKRYWFLAVSSGLPQLDVKDIPSFNRQYETLGDVLEPVPSDDAAWSDHEYLKLAYSREREHQMAVIVNT